MLSANNQTLVGAMKLTAKVFFSLEYKALKKGV
jgi:hypothetical protein